MPSGGLKASNRASFSSLLDVEMTFAPGVAAICTPKIETPPVPCAKAWLPEAALVERPGVQKDARIDIQGFEHVAQGSRAHPALEAAVTGLVRWQAGGQVLPACTGAQDPEHAVEHLALAALRSPTSIGSPPQLGQKRLQDHPLLVGQLLAVGHAASLHPPAIYETASSYNLGFIHFLDGCGSV